MKKRIVHAFRRAAGAWFAVVEFAFSPYTVFSFLLIALVALMATSAIDWYRSSNDQCNKLQIISVQIPR